MNSPSAIKAFDQDASSFIFHLRCGKSDMDRWNRFPEDCVILHHEVRAGAP